MNKIFLVKKVKDATNKMMKLKTTMTSKNHMMKSNLLLKNKQSASYIPMHIDKLYFFLGKSAFTLKCKLTYRRRKLSFFNRSNRYKRRIAGCQLFVVHAKPTNSYNYS